MFKIGKMSLYMEPIHAKKLFEDFFFVKRIFLDFSSCN